MINIRKFLVYGDSWFEINKFILSITQLCENKGFLLVKKTKFKSLKEREYTLEFQVSQIKYFVDFVCMGKFKDNINLNHHIKELLENGGKPDLLIFDFETKLPILGIEDTDTSQIGNSSYQRMERIDWFIKKNIPFLYITFFHSFDRSKNNKQQKRKPSSLQFFFFEQTQNLDILYKDNQDIESSRDNFLIGKYFLEKILKINLNLNKEVKIIQNKFKENNNQYNEFLSFITEQFESKKLKWEWKPDFLKDSKILKELYDNNKLFTFSSKKRQKIGFVEYEEIMNLIQKYTNVYPQIKKTKWVLINPVMCIQKNNNDVGDLIKNYKFKVDPATGEFVFFKYLFSSLTTIALIYSPKANTKNIISAKNKLIFHLKAKADLILLSNNKETKIIDKNELQNYEVKENNNIDEDDISFAAYEFFVENNYLCMYSSAPGSSWTRILYKNQKIIDVSKKDKRPDFIHINEDKKIILIGESKLKYEQLLKHREKHKKTFKDFADKLKRTNLFKNFKFLEINVCEYTENIKSISIDFDLIMVKNNNETIDLSFCNKELFSNYKK